MFVNSLGTTYVNMTCLPPIPDLAPIVSTSQSQSSDTGTIVGAVIGSVAGAIVLIAALYFVIRYLKKRNEITTGRVVELSD